MPNRQPSKPIAAGPVPRASGLLARGPPSLKKHFSIVGIGASAGGLDACRHLLDALPEVTGMAFILIQHLDPTHESMMVDLLTGDTAMAVVEAIDAMPIEPDHFYVIPPAEPGVLAFR